MHLSKIDAFKKKRDKVNQSFELCNQRGNASGTLCHIFIGLIEELDSFKTDPWTWSAVPSFFDEALIDRQLLSLLL